MNQTQVQLTGAAIKALSRDHTSGLIPAFGFPIRCSNDLRGNSGSRVALGLLALCVFEPLAVDGLLGSLDRWETHDVMGAQLLTGLDQGVGIEAGIRSQNNDVVGKCFLDPLEQPGQVVFKHLAGIAGACRAIHSNGVAMQIAQNRSQATALIMAVVRLLFLVAVKLDVCRIHIQEQTTVLLASNTRQHPQSPVSINEGAQQSFVESIDRMAIETIFETAQGGTAGHIGGTK